MARIKGDVRTHGLEITWLGLCLAIAVASPVYGQFEMNLSPATLAGYHQYVKAVETEQKSRWLGRHGATLCLDERPDEKAKVRNGEFAIWDAAAPNTPTVNDGLVHDWIGAMYLPNANIADVLHTLCDWNNQKRYYPELVDSKLVSRQGDSAVGYWRLKRTKFVTVVLDVDMVSTVGSFGSNVSTVTTHTTRISEVLNPGEANEKVLPPGEGHGYLWAFDAFWTLRQERDGVYAECRTVSLSRTIPPGLAWMVGPLVDTMPRESLLATLRGTRKAAIQR